MSRLGHSQIPDADFAKKKSYMRRLTLIILSCYLLSGCINLWSPYSGHNLDDGKNVLGGGYQLDFLEPGVYEIVAKTNAAKSLHPETARKMWRDQAVKA